MKRVCPKSTVHRVFDEYLGDGVSGSVEDFVSKRKSSRIVVLDQREEDAVKFYCLWQFDRGMPITMQQIKAIIRDINQRAINSGLRRAAINIENGPSRKYMRSFFKRHPELTKRQAETVDRGRINMANDETVNKYFDLWKTTLVKLGIAELGDDGNLVNEQS